MPVVRRNKPFCDGVTRISTPMSESNSAHAGAVVALVILASIGVYACRDVTRPASQSDKPNFSIAQGTIIVSPDSMRGWAFYDDQASVACSDNTVCLLVDGPAGQPLGTGSAELAVAATSAGKALILAGYTGTRFDHITDLHYSTFRQTADAGNNLAIALQFNVDYDLTDGAVGYQGRLVFEPYRGNGGHV